MTNADHGIGAPTIERLRSGLLVIALASLSDAEEAAEVVQETMARGLSALADGRLEDSSKLAPFFRGICRHVIVDTIRAKKRIVSLESIPEPSNSDSTGDALSALVSREQRARVLQALECLAPAARECVRLAYFEGLRSAEIAARLGEPGPRVRKRLSRALQQLRQAFLNPGTEGASHRSRSISTWDGIHGSRVNEDG